VTSPKYSTTWDGADLLFDFNFCALGIAPDEAFQTARKDGRILKPGKYGRVYLADHYSRGR
jgi:hypothetical protein